MYGKKRVNLSVDWEEKEPFGPAGKLSGRPWRSEGLVKAPYSRGRLINWKNWRGPGTHSLDKDEGPVFQGKNTWSNS